MQGVVMASALPVSTDLSREQAAGLGEGSSPQLRSLVLIPRHGDLLPDGLHRLRQWDPRCSDSAAASWGKKAASECFAAQSWAVTEGVKDLGWKGA